MCSVSLSEIFMWRFRKASSRVRVSPGRVWFIMSRVNGDKVSDTMGQPNTHRAGESLVSLSGVFLYCNIARWKEYLSRLPSGAVLSVMRQTFYRPDTNLGSAVAIGVGN